MRVSLNLPATLSISTFTWVVWTTLTTFAAASLNNLFVINAFKGITAHFFLILRFLRYCRKIIPMAAEGLYTLFNRE